MTNFKSLVDQTKTVLTSNPEQSIAKFSVEGFDSDNLYRKVKARNFEVAVDEPEALGGTDKAPNPVEYALISLATCQEITYRLYADSLGIPLTDVKVNLEGELDLRGFFGVDSSIRPGYQKITGSVVFDSDASEEQLTKLKEIVDKHCPVLDLFTKGVDVTIDPVFNKRELSAA